MKKLLLISFLFVSFLQIQAQSDTIRIRHWSLGTSLLPVFQPGQEIGVMLKYYCKKGAFRWYNSYSSIYQDKNDGTMNYSTSLGYEIRNGFDKWTVNYGLDLLFYYKGITLMDVNGNPVKSSTQNEGVKLFLGLDYRLNKALSFSSEIGKSVVRYKDYTNDLFDQRLLLMITYHF